MDKMRKPQKPKASDRQRPGRRTKREDYAFWNDDINLTHRVIKTEDLVERLSMQPQNKPNWVPPDPLLPIDEKVFQLFNAMFENEERAEQYPCLKQPGDMFDWRGERIECPYRFARWGISASLQLANQRILSEIEGRVELSNIFVELEDDTRSVREILTWFTNKYRNGILFPPSIPNVIEFDNVPEVKTTGPVSLDPLYSTILKMETIEKLSRNVVENRRDNDQKPKDMWEIHFAKGMAYTWQDLTGQAPADDAHFLGFVVSAFKTIYIVTKSSPYTLGTEAYWENPVAAAVRTYSPDKVHRYPLSAAALSSDKPKDGSSAQPGPRARNRNRR